MQRLVPWLLWSLPLSFFAFQFVLRLFPGLVMQDIYQHYQVDAGDYGLFAGVYYLAYAAMQIPTALFLDRFGAKKLMALCAFSCALAMFLLVASDTWIVALLSRFIIGAASAAGFLGTSKVVANWFPRSQYRWMISLTFTCGLCGAIYGGKPTSLLLSQYGWELVSQGLAVVSLLLALLFVLFLKDKQHDSEKQSSITTKLKLLFSNKYLLILSLGNMLLVGSLEGFADVWGVSFLMTAKDIEQSLASQMISFVFMGMLVGGPLLARLSRYFDSDVTLVQLCGAIMIVVFAVLLLTSQWLPVWAIYSLMFLNGVCCCYQVLVLSLGHLTVSEELASLTVAFINSVNMLGGTLFHSLIGLAMQLSWDGSKIGDVPIYSLQDYNFALSIIPIAALLGCVLLFKCAKALSVKTNVSTNSDEEGYLAKA